MDNTTALDRLHLIPSQIRRLRPNTREWGGRRDSNPRQPESQSGTLPAELRPPSIIGAPGRTRTCDHRLRRPVLYPAELRAHSSRARQGWTSPVLTPRRPQASRPRNLAVGAQAVKPARTEPRQRPARAASMAWATCPVTLSRDPASNSATFTWYTSRLKAEGTGR